MNDTDFDIETRIIRLYGDVDENMANIFLIACNNMKNDNSPITIYINSNGGNAEDGFVIIDIIEQLKTLGIQTNICVLGKAYSVAALILCAGEVKYASKNASIMFHSASYDFSDASSVLYNTKTLNTLLNSLINENNRVVDILKKYTKLPKKLINKCLHEDLYLTPEQAKKYNVIDDIKTII